MQDATALAAAIAGGRTTARAATEASLAALDAQRDLGAVVLCDGDMSLAGAEAADAAPPDRRGPFHGVPFLAKDLGEVAKGLTLSVELIGAGGLDLWRCRLAALIEARAPALPFPHPIAGLPL